MIIRSTKYLIPVLKPGQFGPIPITGEWEFIKDKNKWICHNATPCYYRDIEFAPIALADKKEA